MKISVLVPVYNMASFLERCIDSVLQQTHTNFELLLVDDGSTDGSGTICDKYASQDPRVRVLHQSNVGLAETRNVLCRNAQADYLAPIDADDWVDSTYLETLLRLIEENSVSLAACNHKLVTAHNAVPCYTPKEKVIVLDAHCALHNTLYHNMPDVSVWGKLYHRSLFEGLSYPAGRLYEDTWLFAEIMLRAERIAVTSAPLYNYFIRSDSLCRSGDVCARLDYVMAVTHLTELVLEKWPQEKRGCIRRQVHSMLNVRRYMTNSDESQASQRIAIEKAICSKGKQVLLDGEAPWRDKLAIFLLLIRPRLFDLSWQVYEKGRGDR